jgi:CRISPR-associated protein Csx17
MNGWLSRARNAVRQLTSPTLIALSRQLDETLFHLTQSESSEAVQRVIIAIGRLIAASTRITKLLQTDKKDQTAVFGPPPRLSAAWAAEAEDGSHEFALAAALSGIDAAEITNDATLGFPFRRHLAPIKVRRDAHGRDYDSWDDSTNSKVLAVWTGQNLVRDMVAVLDRRLVEAERRNFLQANSNPPLNELPLAAWRTAPLASVAAFLAEKTDDARIAALVAGLAWVRIRRLELAAAEREDALPFAYAALKPLFDPAGLGPESDRRRIIDPLPLVRLLRGGRSYDAISAAQRFARGAGLASCFVDVTTSTSMDPMRLAASLLFPIAPLARDRLIERAYPDMKNDQEESDAA